MFDVPFVPTPQVVVDEMLRLANVSDRDFVMDLGSGDGRVLITAARKFGARGIGVDLDERLVWQSEAAAEEARVAERVKFLQQDLFKTDLRQATVITMYLLPGVLSRLRPVLLDLKPGTRLVSHDFDLGDWRPDVTTQIRKNTFLWVVPARIGGRWQLTFTLPGGEGMQNVPLELRQKYQDIDGLVRMGERQEQIWEPRLSGDRISFVIVDSRDRDDEAALYFDGKVGDGVIEGQVRRSVGAARVVTTWRATRVAGR